METKNLTIPQPLIEHDQWVCWRYQERGGKRTKVPFNPRSAGMASSTDPRTWSSFQRCCDAVGYDGIGFVFTADDPFVGIDLDDCLDDAGQLSDEARAIIDTLATYAEISPSGRGVKLIGIGQRPGTRSKTTKVSGMSAVEVYDQGRFFTVTGTRLHGSVPTVEDIQKPLDGFYTSWFPEPARTPASQPTRPQTAVSQSDADLLKLIRSSRQASTFDRLWRGDASAHDDDRSAADLALCNILAFWTQRDAVRMDALFRQSGLYREKWDAMRGGQTYGQITVAKAIEGCSEVYEPGRAGEFDWFSNDAEGDELGRRLNSIISGQLRAIPWKWPTIGLLTRALMPGTTTVLCGNPGASKSFFLLECVEWWSAQGVAVSCLMLEDQRSYHLQRALAQAAGNSHLTDTDWIESHPNEARQSLSQHAATIARLQTVITTPPSDHLPSSADLAKWVEHECEQGKRIVCVDPITIASPTDKQHMQDHELIARVKKAVEKHNASALLVTHPKKHPEGVTMDDVSGGASIQRFVQTMLWLHYVKKPEPKKVRCREPTSWVHRERWPAFNREIRILKSRNGPGLGKSIAMTFKSESLTFDEEGEIVRE